ncbi:MAG: hypothetical protein K8R53_09310 [Bacteroidales bacterium]|nr:hypothetical protein [Bacteroidales bacterium]
MKRILLDENVPFKLKYRLKKIETFTVRDKNWNSLKNGVLLNNAIKDNFDVFITTDKNLQYQQNISKLNISVIVLNIVLLKWSYIEPLIPQIEKTLPISEKGKVYII